MICPYPFLLFNINILTAPICKAKSDSADSQSADNLTAHSHYAVIESIRVLDDG
jgi:hypothetical protein